MPAPKIKGRGVKRGKGVKGRPPSGERRDSSEDRERARSRMAGLRGQQSSPKKFSEKYNPRANSSSVSGSRSRGRPPKSPTSGPMTADQRREQNTSHKREKRKRDHISRVRSAASRSRKMFDENQNQDPDMDMDMESGGEEGEGEGEESSNRTADVEEEEASNGTADEVEEPATVTSRTDENPYGKMSKTNFYLHVGNVKERFERDAKNHLERLDVTLALLKPSRFKTGIDYNKFELKIDEVIHEEMYDGFANITERTIRKKAEKIRNVALLCSEPELVIEEALIDTILKETFAIAILQKCGLIVPPHRMSPAHMVSHTYNVVKDQMLRSRRGNDRYISSRAALKTATDCGLCSDTHGHVKLLQDAIGSSWRYAQSILNAIKEGDTEKLFRRNTRKDCIKTTEFPDLLKDWAKNVKNSRPCPGNESVSVGYGKRAPKFILVKPRKTVIKEFLEAHPACPYSSRTLTREWPQNVKAATNRDFDRNVCTVHSNMRRKQKALAKHIPAGQKLPLSCRLMAGMIMCHSNEIDILDPVTWKEDCVHGRCPECPNYETEVPPELMEVEVKVALWGNKLCPTKKKMINSLHDYRLLLLYYFYTSIKHKKYSASPLRSLLLVLTKIFGKWLFIYSLQLYNGKRAKHVQTRFLQTAL